MLLHHPFSARTSAQLTVSSPICSYTIVGKKKRKEKTAVCVGWLLDDRCCRPALRVPPTTLLLESRLEFPRLHQSSYLIKILSRLWYCSCRQRGLRLLRNLKIKGTKASILRYVKLLVQIEGLLATFYRGGVQAN